MAPKNVKRSLGSIFIILIFLYSTLFFNHLSNPALFLANASSEWSQTSDVDFENGTFNNTTIVDSSENAKLSINLSDIKEWTREMPTTKPSTRYGHAMATVYGTHKVVLFGGTDGISNFYNDTWVFDLDTNTWTEKFPINNPKARHFHSMAGVYGTDKVVLFGGTTGIYMNDTWIYDLSDNTWTMKTPSTIPHIRQGQVMSTILGTDNIIMFGGDGGDPFYYKETWIYDLSNNTWTDKMPVNNPSGRVSMAMAPIHGTDKVILFGGFTPFLNAETWIYDFSDNNWTQKLPTRYPSERCYHSMATICGTDEILLFGGWQSTGNVDDTWIYDQSDDNWIKKSLIITPNARLGHGMAFINGTDKVLLFGGCTDSYITFNDTWVYEHVLPTRNGTYVSIPFDTSTNSSFKKITWYASIPNNTEIKFQLRTSLNKQDLNSTNFVGPDGSITSYYISSPSTIWDGHYGDRWVQFMAFFNMSIFTDSPEIREIVVTYNCLPFIIVNGPTDGKLLSNSKPVFNWTFNDLDSEYQAAFQVLIDNNISFESVDYDSDEQIIAEEYWEFSSGTNFSRLPDGTWYWKVRTRDIDGDWSKFSLPRKLIIDTIEPNSVTIFPVNKWYYNSINEMTGSAIDPQNGSGVEKIEIAIKKLRDNYYWNGSTWISLPHWLLASGTNNWTFNTETITWSSGNRYQVQSRATDIAKNLEKINDSIIFYYDKERPFSSINVPLNNSLVNKMNIISGTSIDTGGSKINRIEISIKCSEGNNYWNETTKKNYYWHGTNWGSKERWLPTSGTNQWSFNASAISWSTGNQYLIRSRAIDIANNLEIPSSGTFFTFDDKPPVALNISINNDDIYTASTNVILTLQAEDIGFGISEMSFSTNGTVWSEWGTFNSTKVFNVSVGDGRKFVYFKVRDYAGNIAEQVFDSIILDTTPPTELYIDINDQAKYTKSTNVNLNLDGNDLLSGISKMSFCFDQVSWHPWEPFVNKKSLFLLTGNGEKIVFFRLKDKAGNIAEPIFDSIILDAIPPHSLTILINNGSSETNSTLVNLKLNALDDLSGVYQMSFSTDGKNWTSWENFNDESSIILPPKDGKKTIYFKVKDLAGNVAEVVSATIVLNTTLPEKDNTTQAKAANGWLIWLIVTITVLILIITIFIGFMIVTKQRKRAKQVLFNVPPVTLRLDGGSTPVLSVGQVPATLQVPQLPGKTTADNSQKINMESTSIPVLTASTKSTNTKSSKQIPQVPQLPQLPPAPTIQSKPEVSETTPATFIQNEPGTSLETSAQKIEDSINKQTLSIVTSKNPQKTISNTKE